MIEPKNKLFRPEALVAYTRSNFEVKPPKLADRKLFIVMWLLLGTLVTLLILFLLTQKVPISISGVAYLKETCLDNGTSHFVVIPNENKQKPKIGAKVTLTDGKRFMETGTIQSIAEAYSCNKSLEFPLSNEHNSIAVMSAEPESFKENKYNCYIETGSVYLYKWIASNVGLSS